MIRPRIIVTGVTGKTGSVVVTELLKAGYPVRAMVHREDIRSARPKAQGAEIAVADMSDVEGVADALKGIGERIRHSRHHKPHWATRFERSHCGQHACPPTWLEYGHSSCFGWSSAGAVLVAL